MSHLLLFEGFLFYFIFYVETKIYSDNIQIRIGSTCIKATKVDVKRKSSPTHRRIVSTYQKANLPTSLVEHGAAQKLKDSLKKTKSPMMQQKLAKPGV